MLVNYSSNFNCKTGGVEIFNNSLKKLFNNKGIKIFYFTKLKLLCGTFWGELISSFKLLLFLISNRKINSVLVHHSSFYDVLTLPIIKLSKRKIILISHVGNSWLHIKNKKLKFITNIVFNIFVDNLLILSEIQRQNYTHKNIIKIPTVIDEMYIKQKENKKLNNSKYILFLGRITKVKGIFDLIIAYSMLVKEYKVRYNLKIIGPSSHKEIEILKKLIHENSVDDYVEIGEPIFDIFEKINVIDGSVFGVYPSYYDTLPLTVIEFLARKKVCITTNISETPFFLEEEFLIRPGDINCLKLKMEKLIYYDINNMEISSKGFDYARKVAKGEIINYLKEFF